MLAYTTKVNYVVYNKHRRTYDYSKKAKKSQRGRGSKARAKGKAISRYIEGIRPYCESQNITGQTFRKRVIPKCCYVYKAKDGFLFITNFYSEAEQQRHGLVLLGQRKEGKLISYERLVNDRQIKSKIHELMWGF